MFNIKRNGASVEITDIPQSIPFSVFKNITDETGANECLIACPGGKENYEVVIRHDIANMAGTVAWMVLEAHESGVDNVTEIPESWYSKPTVQVVISNDEIKINGRQLQDVLGDFLGISKSTDILVRFHYEPSGFRRTEITIKPILTETTLEEVLIRIGMIMGKRFLDIVDERTKSISS